MRARLRGDGGQVAGIEVLPFGLLVFVVGSLLAANAWAVVDAKLAVSSAAREGARAYVEAPDPVTAGSRAVAAARDTLGGHGRNPDRLGLGIDGPGGWHRCGRIVVTARYTVPVLTLPWVGGFGNGIEAVAAHSEIIDPYRAGVEGEARCG